MARKPEPARTTDTTAEAGTARTAPLARAAGVNIVSSSHLVSVRSPELSEFEFGLNTAYNAYSRWVVRCMGAAGARDLTFLDVLVLHHVNANAFVQPVLHQCLKFASIGSRIWARGFMAAQARSATAIAPK